MKFSQVFGESVDHGTPRESSKYPDRFPQKAEFNECSSSTQHQQIQNASIYHPRSIRIAGKIDTKHHEEKQSSWDRGC